MRFEPDLPRTDEGESVVEFLQSYGNGPSEKRTSSEPEPTANTPPIWPSKRFLVIIFQFVGYANLQFLQNNASIALVEMTSNRTVVIENETIVIPPQFSWDSTMIALIISAYSYGFLFCAFGGYFCTKFGSSTTYGVSMLLSGVISILQPLSLLVDFYLFLVARALAGIAAGIACASMVEVLARWIPVNERSRMMSYSVSGNYVGAALTFPCCGYIADRFGWPMVFCSTGTFCLISAFLWLLFISDDPAKDGWISEKELVYIMRTVENTPPKQVVHPYKRILTSIPFWALCYSKFAYTWGYILLNTCFPLYVEDMTKGSVDKVGVISAIPSFVCIFMIPIAGAVMDHCQNGSSLKINEVHKIVTVLGFVFASCLFVIPGLITNFTISMICFVLIKLVLAFDFLTLQLAVIYMAPKHSSVIAGFVAFWNVISAILSSTVVGFIVVDHGWREWNCIFFLAAGVLMAGAVIFSLFGSTELQPWAESRSRKQTEEMADENKYLLAKK